MNIFDTIQVPSVRRTRIKGRSGSFDFNCRIGELIPTLHEELVAGDIVKVGVESTIRFPALLKPLFSDNWFVDFFYFFCPYRILWKDWENFLPVYSSIASDGTATTPSLPRLSKTVYTFPTANYPVGSDLVLSNGDDAGTQSEVNYESSMYIYFDKFSLADYLNATTPGTTPTNLSLPLDMNHRAYSAIYEYFFRDENLDRHTWNFENKCFVAFGTSDQAGVTYSLRNGIMSRARRKNYFTGGLPWVQKGPAPALPLYGTGQISSPFVRANSNGTGGETASLISGDFAANGTNIPNNVAISNLKGFVNANQSSFNGALMIDPTVNLQNGTSADINEVWTAMQIQKFLIRNARCGTRYNEFLLANYGVSPRDETLQRPIFLGSTRQPVFVSEVTQQSESSTTPQGTLTAKAMSTGADYICKYSCKEPGVLMGIMCISPGEMYTQGIDRFYLKNSPYDFYNRLFENLADVPVYNAEVYEQDGDGTGVNDNRGTFSFQPIYSEYKSNVSRVAGDLRDTLASWHTGRIFASLPKFNEAFLHDGYTSMDRIFAVGQNTRNCVCHVYNKLDMLRPMSYLNMVGARI